MRECECACHDDDGPRTARELAKVVRRRTLRALVTAVRRLDRVARGSAKFAKDDERQACLMLLRLAPAVLSTTDFRPQARGYHHRHTPEEAAEIYARMKRYTAKLAREEALAAKEAVSQDEHQAAEES